MTKARMPMERLSNDWTPEHIRDYWDWISGNPHLQSLYFTAMVGSGIASFLDQLGRLRGRILDYGCGSGHLINHILQCGTDLECFGVDFSPRSVAEVNARYMGRLRWRSALLIDGRTLPFSGDAFDTITCIETVEHLAPDMVAETLGELRRVLKPGGTLLVTTPFAEQLSANSNYCPFCHSVYHRWQHMQTFTHDKLSAALREAGLSVEYCRNMDFQSFQITPKLRPLRDLSYSRLKAWIAYHVRRWQDRLQPRPEFQGRDFGHRMGAGSGGHLAALARK